MDVVALQAAKTDAANRYDSLVTPKLRRRHLPHAADALSVNGEVPTVTLATATQIASGTTTGTKRIGNVTGADMDLPGDPTFLVGGTPSVAASAASPNNRVRVPQIGGTNAQAARYVPTFNFFTDAAAFEFILIATGTSINYNLTVDGKRSVIGGTATVTLGSTQFVKFDFGTAKTRHISLTVADPDFFGLRLPSTYYAWRPPQPFARRLFALGDSITYGTNVTPNLSWMYDLGRTLGCDDVWNVGIGGTNWTATDGSQFGGNRMTDIASIVQPNDVVVFFGSRNDPSGNGTQLAAITAAVTATLASVASCKNVFVATNMTVINTMAASVIAGATAAGRPGIDASGWITGTGTTTSPNGTGNGDRYLESAGIHPVNAAAYAYLARRWDAAVRALLPA